MKRLHIVMLTAAVGMSAVATTSRAAGYSMQVSVTNFAGRGTLTNFPTLVKLDASNTDSYAGFLDTTDGYDLRFWTNSALSGTDLNYEIESFDTNGTSYIWVRVPEFTQSGSIWASWGNPAYTNQQSYTTNGAVWSEGYVGVWHLGNALDSGTNGYDGSVQGNAAPVAGGVINSAYTFDGDGDYIDLEDHDFTTDLTIEAWARRVGNSTGRSGTIVAKKINDAAFFYEWYNSDYNDTIRFYTWGLSSGADLESTSSLADDVWYHLSGTYDGSTKRIYLNGSVDNSTLASGNISVNNENLMIGYGVGSGGKNNYFNGLIDEVRISNVARSTNWIWASYMNQGANHEALVEYGTPLPTSFDGILWYAEATSDITTTSAVAMATVNTNLTETVLVWEQASTAPNPGTTSTNEWANRMALGAQSDGLVTGQIANLDELTDYVWRLYGENETTNAWSDAVDFTTLATSVVVLSTASTTTSGNTYTTNDLGGFFPPPATDKLVVTVHDEGSSPSSVTYAGTVLAKAIEVNPGGRYVAVYFLDYATTPTAGDLVINGSSGSGVSVLALQGTADGYGSSTNATSASFVFDALFEGSAVVVGLVANQNSGTYTGTADPPLTPLLEDANVGSSLGVSGYATNVSAGASTYSFSNISAGSPAVAAVAFPPVGADDIPPTITSTSAADDAGNSTNSLLTDAILTVNFDEAISAGLGSLILKDDGGTTVETYDVTSSTKLSFVVDTLTITPAILAPSTSYFIQIPSGAIEDGSGNTTNYPNVISFTTGPWLTVAASGESTYTTNDLRGFDPSGYDKLVVITMDENGSYPSSITWGGTNLTQIVVNDNSSRRSSMWYVDGPFGGPENLVVSGIGSSFGVSLLALPDVEPGVATYSNASLASIDFTTTSDDSYVVAGCTDNGGPDIVGASPLTTYFSRDVNSSAGGSGVADNGIAGSQTFSFNGASSSPSFVIAEFVRNRESGTVFRFR